MEDLQENIKRQERTERKKNEIQIKSLKTGGLSGMTLRKLMNVPFPFL